MYEKLLVPLDGSKLAETALPYAEEIAGRFGSDLEMIYVCKSAEDPLSRTCPAYFKQTQALMQTRTLPGKPENRQIQIRSICLTGDPAGEIIDYAEKEPSSLVIMATRGLSGIQRGVLGSVADRVVRAVKQPVLLIRADLLHPPTIAEPAKLRKILVCLDGSKTSETVLPYASEIALKFKAEMVLFQALEKGYYFAKAGGFEYVYHPEKQTAAAVAQSKGYLDAIGQPLQQQGISVRSEVRLGDAAEQIIGLADEISASMVAISTHGRSGLFRWALGSVAAKVLHGGNTPLLLARPRRET